MEIILFMFIFNVYITQINDILFPLIYLIVQ